MLSKNDIKNIKSLEKKKFRDEKQLFVAEGHKLTDELMGILDCVLIAATKEWIGSHGYIAAERVETITPDELQRASLLRSPQDVLAVFRIPDDNTTMLQVASRNLVLALDGIQDPGNLGTIVRIADWFGIRDVFCSPDCADIYGPKAIQSTMGAIARVRLHYVDLPEAISALPSGTPVYGTFLDGENIYKRSLNGNGVIIMGNEGNGIRPSVGSLVKERLYIPCWPADAATSESLNVAAATAVICAEFRRRNI
ncbi:MAG: RNA methyltransferase [Bacteroidaceae bacterium]|nr:RNA methyltransferase [Bacteroidaceae bacterium]